MNPLDNFSQLQNLGLARQATGAQTQSVGQDQFLQLMLAQFKNQDPFEPMENGEFLGQLAQFSTASGIKELQTAFSDFSNSVYSDNALQASSLVGKDMLVSSELVRSNGNGTPVSGAVDLDGASGTVSVDVLDASGQLVRTLELGVQQSGTPAFNWDGRNASGNVVPAGIYQFSARVTRGAQVESVPTLIRASVDSVTLGRNGNGVTINSSTLGAFSLSAVRQIF